MALNLEELLIKSIAQNAELATKIIGIETTLQHIRSDNAQMLRDFNDSMRVIADMQRQLVTNSEEHRIVHARIDEVKEELDGVRDDIHTIRTTCATNGQYRNQMQHLKELITQLEFAAKIFSYKVFGLPAWILFVSVVGMGFVIDIIKHRDAVTLIFGLFK